MEGQEEVFDEPSGFEQLFCLNLQGEEGKDEVEYPKRNQDQKDNANVTD